MLRENEIEGDNEFSANCVIFWRYLQLNYLAQIVSSQFFRLKSAIW